MPRRPSNLPRSFVEEHRRLRLAAATAALVRESGREALTVGATCRRARIGRGSYYEVFDGISACLRYCFERSFELAATPLRAAATQGDFAERVGAGVRGLYAALAAEPALCGLCLVHSFGAPEAAGCDHVALVGLAAELLVGDRGTPGEPCPPGSLQDGVAGLIVWRGAQRLRAGEAERLASEDAEAVIALALALLAGDQAGGP